MNYLYIIIFLFFSICLKAEKNHYDIVVAKDGSGDYKTLTEAVTSLPYFSYERIVIYIKKGVYNEKILIEQDNISLIGEDRDSTIIEYSQLRSDWIENNDPIGAAVINLNGDDIILKNLTIRNTQLLVGPHAFTIYGKGTRTIIVNCNVTSNGGDTVSLWNHKGGMYYHSNCFFQGAVDFVCPRGWCYIRDSEFYEVKEEAALWHDGGYDNNQKFVLVNCSFDGVEGFKLGRHHYDAQFYLIECGFSRNMADEKIYRKTYPENPEKNKPYLWGDRYYFYGCKRDSVDFKWFSDNIENTSHINALWTFNEQWAPENTDSVTFMKFVIKNKTEVYFYADESLTVRGIPKFMTANGKVLTYETGRGRSMMKFVSDKQVSNDEIREGIELIEGDIIYTGAYVEERSVKRRMNITR